MVKIYKGIPYTGTLPAVLTGTKAGYLHRYKIYGNTDQAGTPTPENPIVPSECGERTEQLFDISSITLGKWYTSSGDLQNQAYGAISAMDEINTGQLTIKWHGLKPYSFSYVWFDNNKDFISRSHYGGSSGLDDEYTDTVPANAVYYILQMSNGTIASRPITVEQITSFQTMLNVGSTALPYEPYGYKLPLLSGSTPVDIYLGESQTTRKIKKLVLTGEENWTENVSDIYRLRISTYGSGVTGQGISSHFISVNSTSEMPDNSFLSGENFMYVKNTSAGSLTGWKTYLQQQYANGTPVTVWYVLATEKTGTINEPLRKIGDYADTIDSTQTTAQIPTTVNSTTISWGGQGLAPSEFDSIAEWVSATPKIYTNGAWTDAQTYTYDDGAWVADN